MRYTGFFYLFLLLSILVLSCGYPQSMGSFDEDGISDTFLAKPQKRGWCRGGYAYNPVLNRCIASRRIMMQGRPGRSSYRFGK